MRSRHVPPKLPSKSNSTSSDSEVNNLSNSVFPILAYKDVVKSYATLLPPRSAHPSTFLGISPSIVLTEEVLESRRACAAKKVMQKHGLTTCDRAGLLLEQNYNSWLQLQRGVECSVKMKRLSHNGVERLRRSEHIKPSLGVLAFLRRYGKKVKGNQKSALKSSNANVSAPVQNLQTFNFLACPKPVKTKVKVQKIQKPVPSLVKTRSPIRSYKTSTVQNDKANVKVSPKRPLELLDSVLRLNSRKSRHPCRQGKDVLTKSNQGKHREKSNSHGRKYEAKRSQIHRKKSQKVSPRPEDDLNRARIRSITNEIEIYRKLLFDFDTRNNSIRKSFNVTAAGSAQQPNTLLNLRRNTVPFNFKIPKIKDNENGPPPVEPQNERPVQDIQKPLASESSATCCSSAPLPELQEGGSFDDGEILIDVEGVENVIELHDGGDEQVSKNETIFFVVDQETGAITQMKISESGQLLEEFERGDLIEDEVEVVEESSYLEEQAAVLQATEELYEAYNSENDAEEAEAEEEKDGSDQLTQMEPICDALRSDSVEGGECEEVEGIEQDLDEEPRQISSMHQQGFVNEVPKETEDESSEEQLRQIAQLCAAFEESEELEMPKVESKSTPEKPKISITVELEEGEIVDEEENEAVSIAEEIFPDEDVQAKVKPDEDVQAIVKPDEDVQAKDNPDEDVQAKVKPDEDVQAKVKPDDDVLKENVELEQDGDLENEVDFYSEGEEEEDCFVQRKIFLLNPVFQAQPISKDDVNLPLPTMPICQVLKSVTRPSIILAANKRHDLHEDESMIPLKKRKSYRLIDID